MTRRETKKTAEAPAHAPLKLYKVLTADGRAPFVPEYRWSLPTKRDDGTWAPGEWHEEAPDKLCTRGLHVTACPGNWMHGDPRGGAPVVYEAECEGVVGDPAEHVGKVIAARVRLLRPVDRSEVIAADEAYRRAADAYEAKRQAEERRAHMRKLAEKARRSAASARATDAARREAGVPSPALLAFETLVGLTPADSWRDVNACRYELLRYATRHLDFDEGDVCAIYKKYGGYHWFGAGSGSDEALYAAAVGAGNNSACVAWERYFGRKPWRAPDHDGKRVRLHVGAGLSWEGLYVEVTSFDDKADAFVACAYEDVMKGKGSFRYESRKIARRFKVTRGALRSRAAFDAAFAAKKKPSKKGGAK